MLKHIYHQLSRLPLPLVVILSLGLIVLVGSADYLTGHNFELDFLYLLPVALAAWFTNPWIGLVMGGVAALVWGWADWAAVSVPPPWPQQIWNVLIQLASFQTLALLVSALRKQTGLLKVVAGQDYLTGLANRRTFYTEANQELSRSDRYGQIFTVAYLDVDNFKFVNDTYGHVVGDELLRQIAATLRQNTRRMDVVARLGGDEFGILLPATDANGARQTLLKLQRLILPAMAEFRWPVTFSLGVVTFRRPTSTVDELMRRVDEVMYTVKQQGKNNVVFAEWPQVKAPEPDQAADDEVTLPV
jgi:diguanylate cyclase (GGDEF)-like protein